MTREAAKLLSANWDILYDPMRVQPGNRNIVEAYANGATLLSNDGTAIENPHFNEDPKFYTIAHAKKRVKLCRDDLPKTPFFVRSKALPSVESAVVAVSDDYVTWSGDCLSYDELFERNHMEYYDNGDWRPFWKEEGQ